MSVKPPLATVPPVFEMATSEKLPLGFDTTKLLGIGQSMSNPVCVMTDVTAGKTVTLEGPNIDGNVIVQDVLGSALVAQHIYQLAVSFDAEMDTTWTMILTIRVPQ